MDTLIISYIGYSQKKYPIQFDKDYIININMATEVNRLFVY